MTENYIKNKKLCEISKNIPFLESYNCRRERFSEDDLNEVIEKKNTLEEARDKISGFFSSLVPNDKVTYDPSNLIIILRRAKIYKTLINNYIHCSCCNKYYRH